MFEIGYRPSGLYVALRDKKRAHLAQIGQKQPEVTPDDLVRARTMLIVQRGRYHGTACWVPLLCVGDVAVWTLRATPLHRGRAVFAGKRF